MIRSRALLRPAPVALFLALIALAGCQPGTGTQGPASADLAADVIRPPSPFDPLPKGGPGECWAADVTPAVFETVTEQVLVTEAQRDAAGNLIAPPVYSSEAHQRVVKEREAVHFRTPCPDQMTVAFVATLQRALKARGYYMAPVSGTMDAATAESIRRFQEPLGLDSPTLSLRAARALGIVTTDLDEIQ
ncbi:peptidoglycan-binding protein [Gemmobacter sp. LW-1]|jgi:hypothetical protein|uniref:peptidoglycan-binding domain-containing protein n=1 Tax=Gemmobacter sp. LW-1 TaxID=1529005 RepID=UPI0006C747CA|nr:peptidoglycan-binding domain-containing protein [Gemmobacter sp. LW-1]